ncbi:MAG TPA: hypothetical protein VNI02_09880 [Blastocatellia bacterium]|jgi:hypothetical protein|nr:hypothetical protein [Blastocatellia bacterium]
MRSCRHSIVSILSALLLVAPSLAARGAQSAGKRQADSNAAGRANSNLTQQKAKRQSNTDSARAKAKPQPKPRQGSSAGAAIFVVTQDRSGSYVEPLVGVIEGRYIEPPSGASENFEQFAGRYYRAGQKYRLLFGGGEVGTATLKEWAGKASDCGRSRASVELETAARIGGLVMGVATNSDSLGRKPPSRRFPAAKERSAVSEMALKIFRQKGVPAASLQGMKTINMTAVDLNGDGKMEMVASFTARTGGRGEAVHHLFLIAQPDGDGFDVGLMRYARTAGRDLPQGASLDDVDEAMLTEVLVDQLDLDNDRLGEVITMTKGFEGATYKIYKMQKGQWATIYEFYSYRCAY